MSVRELHEAGEAINAVNTDVCVIGAGIAGLVLARRLEAAGRKVVVLESGSRRRDPAKDALNRIEDPLGLFTMAEKGRARGFGGTSALWGGRLLPLAPHDMGSRAALGLSAWPIARDELESYGSELQDLFGLDGGTFEEEFYGSVRGADSFFQGDRDFVSRWPKWPTFRKCNLANLLGAEIERSKGLEVWLSATARSFTLSKDSGKIISVEAVGRGGCRVFVSAAEFALAAGTIESTRLLLLLDRLSDENAFRNCMVLGRFFQDHLSCDLGEIGGTDRDTISNLFGFHFNGATRRNLHLELTKSAQESDRIGSGFLQVSLEPAEDSTLGIIKNFLRGLQRNELDFAIGQLPKLAAGTGDLVHLAYWRILRKQLYLPADVRLVLSGVVEQLPNAENRITLSSQEDSTGVPFVRLDWRTSDAEEQLFRSLIRRGEAYWTRAGFDQICPVRWRYSADDPDILVTSQATDIAHPSGSARMGHDPTQSVVDPWLRCHAVCNLSLATAATFPTAGSANPTFTIIQLAMRAADGILAALQQRTN